MFRRPENSIALSPRLLFFSFFPPSAISADQLFLACSASPSSLEHFLPIEQSLPEIRFFQTKDYYFYKLYNNLINGDGGGSCRKKKNRRIQLKTWIGRFSSNRRKKGFNIIISRGKAISKEENTSKSH